MEDARKGVLMAKLKLTILNMKEFLHAVNECRGKIRLLSDEGKSRVPGNEENLVRHYVLQEKLWETYRKNGNSLPLLLDIADGKDYLHIVNYYAGDC